MNLIRRRVLSRVIGRFNFNVNSLSMSRRFKNPIPYVFSFMWNEFWFVVHRSINCPKTQQYYMWAVSEFSTGLCVPVYAYDICIFTIQEAVDSSISVLEFHGEKEVWASLKQHEIIN